MNNLMDAYRMANCKKMVYRVLDKENKIEFIGKNGVKGTIAIIDEHQKNNMLNHLEECGYSEGWSDTCNPATDRTLAVIA